MAKLYGTWQSDMAKLYGTWQSDMTKSYGTWQSDMTKHVQALVYLLLVSASLIVLKYSALAGWGRSRSSLIRFRDVSDIIQGVFLTVPPNI